MKKSNLPIKKETDDSFKEALTMATQIAATPVLYGKEAKKVLKEAKTTQTRKSKENAQNIISYFSKFTKKGE
jgi:hypothetical protein